MPMMAQSRDLLETTRRHGTCTQGTKGPAQKGGMQERTAAEDRKKDSDHMQPCEAMHDPV